jgi:glycosyltransferase involved in cell wall biosynthesis
LDVLQLIAGLDIGGANGGAERHGLELAAALMARGCPARLCVFWQRECAEEARWLDYLRNADVETFFAARWPGRFTWPAYLSGVRAIRRQCLVRRPDIIHSHFQMGTLAALALRTTGAAGHAVRTAHISLEWGEGLTAVACRSVFTNWLYPALADREIAVSAQVLAQLQSHPATRLLRRRPLLIPNAIQPESILALARQAVAVPWPAGDHPLLIHVGRLTRQKGQAYLLQAFRAVVSQWPGARLVLVGEGELAATLRAEVAALGIAERVTFAGTSSNVPALLARADLFVLPSLWEGLPTVMLESIVCGLPVVATGIPGIREVITDGESGWLAPPADAAALAAAITDALRSPEERRARAERARPAVAPYTMDAASAALLELYRQLATN